MGLTLTRKVGQRVVIDGKIIVEVLKPRRRGETRLDITAPAEIPVHRKEVYDQIQRGER